MAYGGGYAGGYADSAISGMPGIAVEVAFESMPDSEDPEWFDVTADLRVFSTHRGRQRELDVYAAGEAEVVLGNKARNYDPDYADGDHWPNVKPMRRMRILAGWDETTYPLYDGYADRWPQSYSPPHDAWATLQATDGFKVLNKKKLPTSVYVEEITGDDPTFWWRLDETSGSVTAENRTGMVAEAFGLPQLGAPTLIAFDPGAALTQDDETSGFTATGTFIPGGASLAAFTLEATIKTAGTAPGLAGAIVEMETTDVNVYIMLSVPAGGWGLLQVFTTDPGGFGTAYAVATSTIVADDDPHQLVGTFDGVDTIEIWCDGVLEDSVTDPALNQAISGDQVLTIGNIGDQFGAGHVNGLIGTIDEIALYVGTALSGSRIAAHSEARATAWGGDETGERLHRILDIARWPVAARDIDDGKTTLQGASLATSALEHAQKVEQSEFGALFIARDGDVRFVERDGLINRTPVAVFGDDPGEPDELGYRIYESDNGDELIRNPVTVSRNEGEAQTAVDETGIDEYLDHQFTLDGLLHDSDALSRDAADFLVSEYKDPKTRITRLVVTPRVRPDDLWPVVLGAELGDVFTVIRRPQGIGAPIQQDCEIQGIEHSVTPKGWETTFTLSPAYTGSFLELDTGTGRLATAGAELAAGLDAVATSFAVTMTGGDLFTTAAGDFPFDVSVAAERMTATAISGASSPQTFTVTRPNPTTHTAGEAVQVADPVRIYF